MNDNRPLPTTGTEVRAMREAANVGRVALARVAGVHASTVRSFEMGKRNLKPATCAAIIAACARFGTMPQREHQPPGPRRGKWIRRTCPHLGCGKRLSPGARTCRRHWADGMNPHRYTKRRQGRTEHYSSISAFISDWGAELRLAVHDNIRAYGVMPQCRGCREECKVPAVPNGAVTYCPRHQHQNAFVPIKNSEARI